MRFSIYIIVLLCLNYASAQTIDRSTIGAYGASGSTSSINLSYTLGGISVSTGSSNSYVLTQDFEQPQTITKQEDFTFPNAFSPNGDGVNDTWLIRFENNYQDLNITILNRWGDKMCQIEDYQSGEDIWNGKLDNEGAKAVNGTYFYIVESKEYNIKLNGWLQVVR